jgi:glycosyltransferase involved in cell wall biosynthesis
MLRALAFHGFKLIARKRPLLQKWIVRMSESRPTVSIVLPTYNRAKFIGQAVTSALGQTYDDIEVLVVDDGSVDDTSDIIGTFSDPRLKYIKLTSNSGRSSARNRGLQRARGDYIAFLDSDDYYLPQKIEMQVQFLNEHPDVDMVYTASACVDTDDRPIQYFYRAPVSGKIYNEIAFFKPLTITLPTVMLRRGVLTKVGSFDEQMERFEDTDFWRRIAKHFKIAGIDEVTCHIRSHQGNHISSFEPESFKRAIAYYVEKVFREDRDIDPLIVGAGARRLHELYGSALLGMPGAKQLAVELQQKGQAYFEPLVSIIIPVFNGGNYLSQAIDSALAQTYKNIEVVVVNDGSNDGGETERIALSYGERIRYFVKPNGGCSSALNRAVQEARGQYISWLSHDDLLAPMKIERQVGFLAQQPDPSCCIVYGDYSVFAGARGVWSNSPACVMPPVKPENFRYFLTTHNILHGCTLLIPKRAIERHGMFDEDLQTVLDFDLWFKLAKTERFLFLPGVVVHSRAHPDQDTNRKRGIHMREANELLARFVDELSADEVRTGSSRALVHGYYVIAQTLRRRNFSAAASHALAVAERTARTAFDDPAIKANGSADGANEALTSLFALARRTVELEATLQISETGQGQSDARNSEYESAALPLPVSEHLGVKSIALRVARVCINSQFFGSAVRTVAKSPSMQMMARSAARRLPLSTQHRLASIWHRYRI